ncbi:MAG: glycosyltransferase family 2 protein [Planctomycetota bacterium]
MTSTKSIEPKLAPFETVPLGVLSERPLVSIVVPSFNQGKFIGDTIRSILEQDYRPLKIHVMDGASTDNTVKVLESFGDLPELDWVSEPDNGVVEAVNKAFARAEGEVIGIQSSDDLYHPGAISTMVEKLQEYQDHGLLYGDMETIGEQGEHLFQTSIAPFSIEHFLSKQTWVPQSSAFFRRELLDACGGWDSRYFSADTELWMRFVFRTKVKKLDLCLSQRRVHDDQRNHQAAKIADAYRRMVKDSADIPRASKSCQRAAVAGTHIHSIRYNATESNVRASLHLWQALFADPSLWPKYKNSLLLIPGWVNVRILLSKLKRLVLRKPANA